MAAQRSAPVENLSVVLLLGGRSTRMGSPKHLLLHPASQQPLYLHHLELLRQLEREGVFSRGVFVSARADQRAALELPEGVACVEDDPDRNGDIGPASGILQASAARPDATWLVLAVDLPFVTRASILHLLSAHAPDSPVSLFLHPSDGNPEPLFSIWTPRALEQLRHNCREGKSGPCRAAKDVWGGKIVEGKGGVKVLEEDSVRDADTPEEWEKALAALARKELGVVSESQPITPPPSPPVKPRPPFSSAPRRSIPFHAAIERIERLPLSPAVGAVEPRTRRAATATSEPVTLLPLVDACGGIATDTVHAVLPHPLHDNSAMDGYAVRSALLSSASPDKPVLLPTLGRIVAGDPIPPTRRIDTLGTQGCWEIMTGAVFPSDEFDAVVKVEDVRRTSETDPAGRPLIRFEAPTRPRQHRRARGEQVRAGDVILRSGERVSPEKVLLLAACGVPQVAVHSLPPPVPFHGRVGVVATGKEVVPLSSLAPDCELAPGQVVDCITPYLSSLLRSHGFESVLLSPSGDSPSSFTSTVSAALALNPPLSLLVTVAGVSRGTTDHIPSSLASLGAAPSFHGVAIRPGAPVMLSHHAASGTPVLSLPGNPMASAACMRSFGDALLGRLRGERPGWTDVRELESVREWAAVLGKGRGGSSSFWAVPVDAETGLPSLEAARAKQWKGPGALGSLVGAGAWLRMDADDDRATWAAWRSF